jgi:hypothetical protein
MTPLRFSIVVATVPRPADYLGRTLAGLPVDRPVALMAGSPDAAHLDAYRADPRFRIETPSAAELPDVSGEADPRRAAEEGRLLVVEDDVAFAPGWADPMAAIVGAIEAAGRTDYLLSLYYPYPAPADPGAAGFVAYPPAAFYGTQAVLFAGCVAREFRPVLLARAIERYELEYDLLLARFAESRGFPIFAAVPALAQHIGVVSSGLTGHFHSTPCFAGDRAVPAR